MTSRLLAAYYARLKSEPCIACNRRGVDIAHLLPVSKPLGFAANQYRTWSARSHKGPRAFTAVPLCRECHDNVTVHGEEWLDGKLIGGRRFAYAYALRVLAEVSEECCEEEADT